MRGTDHLRDFDFSIWQRKGGEGVLGAVKRILVMHFCLAGLDQVAGHKSIVIETRPQVDLRYTHYVKM